MKTIFCTILVHCLWITKCLALQPFFVGALKQGTITETLTPNGAGAYSTWTYTPAGTYVDISTDDGDTSYAYKQTAGRVSVALTNLSSITTASKIIVYMKAYNANDGCSTRDHKVFYRMSSTDYDSTDIAVTCESSANYSEYSYEWTGSWSSTDINGMEIGVNHGSVSSYAYVTFVKAVVEGL